MTTKTITLTTMATKTDEKTVNEELRDDAIALSILALLFALGLSDRMLATLNSSASKLAALLRESLRDIKGIDSVASWRTIQKAVKAVTKARAKDWARAGRLFEKEIGGFAKSLPELQARILASRTVALRTEKVTTPSAARVVTDALSKPVQGRTAAEWIAALERTEQQRITATIQAAVTAGEDVEAIVQRVVGSRAQRYVNGLLNANAIAMQTVARTVVNETFNLGRRAVEEANRRIGTIELFVAILDSRTTKLCESLDGSVYYRGEGPQPPLHPNCRSSRIVLLDRAPIARAGLLASTERNIVADYARDNDIAVVTDRESLPRGYRQAFDVYRTARVERMVGSVPDVASYNDWMRGMPVDFQNFVLGEDRAIALRKGNLVLTRFDARPQAALSGEQFINRALEFTGL